MVGSEEFAAWKIARIPASQVATALLIAWFSCLAPLTRAACAAQRPAIIPIRTPTPAPMGPAHDPMVVPASTVERIAVVDAAATGAVALTICGPS